MFQVSFVICKIMEQKIQTNKPTNKTSIVTAALATDMIDRC